MSGTLKSWRVIVSETHKQRHWCSCLYKWTSAPCRICFKLCVSWNHVHSIPSMFWCFLFCSGEICDQLGSKGPRALWKFPRKHYLCVCFSHLVVPDSATSWTVAHQTPLSIEFSRQEYWSRLSSSSPGDLPGPGIEPWSPALWAVSLPSDPPGKPRKHYLLLLLSRFSHVRLCATP